MNNCKFCKKETDNGVSYFPMTLIIEKYEELKIKYNNDWDKMLKELPEKEFDGIMFYGQLLNTIGKSIVCNDCLEKDDKLYEKYFGKFEPSNTVPEVASYDFFS